MQSLSLLCFKCFQKLNSSSLDNGETDEPESPKQCTEVRFASFLSGGFTTMSMINLPDWKLPNGTSALCTIYSHNKTMTGPDFYTEI